MAIDFSPLPLAQFDIHTFINVERHQPDDAAWSAPSPFDLRFRRLPLKAAQTGALAGTGIYLISHRDQVAYLGKYQPANGDIIADRWARHLQTITARGYDIGLGGKDAQRRLPVLLDAVTHPKLRRALEDAYEHDRRRFRDTGYNTSPNRLRFASDNWDFFSSATPCDVLGHLTFTLLPLTRSLAPEHARAAVSAIEKRVLQQVKPICNQEYRHHVHRETRSGHSLSALVEHVRDAAAQVTGAGPTRLVRLAGKGEG